MREPHLFANGLWQTYSSASTELLQRIAGGYERNVEDHIDAEFRDPDFRRRYAALLLKERGL